jgi:hypothetical protein
VEIARIQGQMLHVETELEHLAIEDRRLQTQIDTLERRNELHFHENRGGTFRGDRGGTPQW